MGDKREREVPAPPAEPRPDPGGGSPTAVLEGRVAELAATVDRLRAELEQKSRVEEQLRQAQKMEAVARLAGGVAHDFNNVLTVITSYASLLQSLPDASPDLREAADEIAAAARRGAALARQILLFGRRQIPAPRVVSLNAAVADLEKLIRRTAGEDVRVELQLDPDPCPVLVDPGHLEQVLMNLVLNARDAMPEGGRLVVATGLQEIGEATPGMPRALRPGRYCALAVSDEGTGISPGARARLFEPFFTTKEEGTGTGLGLSTAQGIARQAGGDIAVESRSGPGSTFRVLLPRAEDAEPGSPPTALGLAGRRALVVEDDEAIRRIARRILERHGYEVLEASSGSDAFAVADRETRPIHLLLTDVVLPRLNGFQVAERLATARPDLRVVYMSGYGEAAITRHAPPQRDLLLVRKPFSPDDLARAAAEAFARPAPRRR